MASLQERITRIVEEAREEGIRVGEDRARQQFYGNAASVLTALLFADAAEAAASRLRQDSPEFAEQMHEFALHLRAFATPAKVETVDPAEGTTGVAPDSPVLVRFAGKIDPRTVTPETFTIAAASGGQARRADVSYDEEANTVSLLPEEPLSDGVAYRVSVSPEVRAAGGQPLGQEYTWSFTVAGGG